jgi:VPDSG-CTERM motif
MGKVKYIAALLIAVACVGLQQAKGDLINYTITIGNPAASGYAAPYATVTVNRTSSTAATITFTSLTANGNIYLFGSKASVAVNVNAFSWKLGTITGSNSGTGFTPGIYSNGGSGNVAGFGVLNQTINSFGGYKQSSSTISFTLTNTSGSWSSAGQVLKANAKGYFAAVHIFVTASPANAKNGALVTGFAANGVGVPDGGATVMLLGAALGALGVARHFFRR